MFRVFSCLSGEHDWRLVVLAGLVCLLASLVAVSLLHRARKADGRSRLTWLTLAGTSTGCGLWATHFIAMLAYEPVVPVAYEIQLTLLSLISATVVTTVGLAIAAGHTRFAGAFGGAVVGAGIATMHYLGMAAVQLPGRVHWHSDLVLASIVLGLTLGAAAFAIATHRETIRTTVGAAALLTLAIVSHHFTAMGAVEIVLDPQRTLATFTFSNQTLALAIAGIAMAILGLSVAGALADSYLNERPSADAAQADARLRERNARLDSALNNMTQGLCMFDAGERVVVLNRRFLELYQLSPEVVRPGCTLMELLRHRKEVGVLQSDPEEFYRILKRDLATGRMTQWVHETRDHRAILAQNQPMPGGGWVTTHEDITDRRAAEAVVRDQKLKLDAALNNMSQGLCLYDGQQRIILCNRRYMEMYSLSPEDVKPGRSLWELIELRNARGLFACEPQYYNEQLKAALAERRSISFVVEMSDGRSISIANTPMDDGRWVATHEDITEQRRNEERLREQKLQLDTALDNMAQGLCMFDKHARMILCNQRYLQIYGMSDGDVWPGMTLIELLEKRRAQGTWTRDAHEYVAELRAALAKGETFTFTVDGPGGMVISIFNRPMPDGRWVSCHEDITERRRAERERDRSQMFATTVIENVPATIVVKDARTLRYVMVNRAGEAYFGSQRETMIGKTSQEVFTPETAKIIAEHDLALLRTGQAQFYDEHPTTTPGAGPRIVTTARMPIRDAQGDIQYLLTVIEDRTNRKRAEAQIAHMVHHDPLTGLPNRAAFNECLTATIENAAKDGTSFALLSLDLDRFKEINDVFGHVIGDDMLCEVGRRIQKVAGGAFIARLGGDEFMIISVESEQPAAAEGLATQILQAAAEEFNIDGHHLRTGMSIGVSIYPANAQDAEALVANADAALYRAKSEGRSIYRFFEAAMDERLRERRALQHDLQSAIENGEMMLNYQPQSKINGEIFGFEALARWRHPTRGLVSPGKFIPLAEESGVIVPLGEWILREACREAASWAKPLQIAINLSPVQFRHGDLAAVVHSILLETGLAPARLELEITEGVLIGDFSRALATLRRLKALGVRIAMDDFGTGYSSLSYLQAFPFDKIKIDQAFISNLESNPQSATIVRAVIGLARGLNVPVLAEGVETKDQLAFLAKEQCDEVQGYLIGRPLPIEDYAALTGAPIKFSSRKARAALAG